MGLEILIKESDSSDLNNESEWSLDIPFQEGATKAAVLCLYHKLWTNNYYCESYYNRNDA